MLQRHGDLLGWESFLEKGVRYMHNLPRSISGRHVFKGLHKEGNIKNSFVKNA